MRILPQVVMEISVIVLMFILTVSALSGASCPLRKTIYPCSCISRKVSRAVTFTAVTCHRVNSTDDLDAIFSALRGMTIDQFNLYDSFWNAGDENKQVLPSDWMTLLRIKEVEIVDTKLASHFACTSKLSCKNTFTTRFTAINSSSDSKIRNLCELKGRMFSWTSCQSRLQQFHFTHGKLTVAKADLFPQLMQELTEVDLSYNHIARIENGVFKNTPKLTVLNLAHNNLQSLDTNFTIKPLSNLTILDVSSNQIRTLAAGLFALAPNLKELHAQRNFIIHLKENHWTDIGEKMRFVDLRDNPLHCNCDIGWINGTISAKISVRGHCASPPRFENFPIRTASRRVLNYTCDGNGDIITTPSKKKSTTVLF